MFLNNNRLFFILAVLCIFIIIPCSFAADLTENQTDSILNTDDSSQDAIVTADENIIYVSPTAGDDGNGSSENPYAFSKAVETYDSSSHSKIIMKNGEYKFTEQVSISKDINIEGESYNNVILNGTGVCTILKVSNSNIMLSNLKFVNGYSEHELFDNQAGGLHIGYNTKILIDNCIFENNANGALSATGSNSVINITNSVFDSNFIEYDSGAKGAAIFAGADNLELNVMKSTFKNNLVNVPSNGQAGAIYGGNNFKSFLIDNCIFINNTADEGSAILSYCGGDIYLFNNQFINQTPSVVYDEQRNSNYLAFYIKNNTFDAQSSENIVVKDKVNLINLDSNTNITGNDIEMDVGGDENYTVTLTDGNGDPISGKEIIVNMTNYYNQVTILNCTTNSNGQAIFSMKNQKPGKWKVRASFAGDNYDNAVNTTNTINIRAEESVNLMLIPDSIKITQGDSYIITGIVCDDYYEPSYILDTSYVDVEWMNPNKTSVPGITYVDGCQFTFDISRCGLKSSNVPYEVTFIVDPGSYVGYIPYLQAVLTVDVSVDLPEITDIDVIYVASNGSDSKGNGSVDNPLESVQLALSLNDALGGGKTIMVGEGTFNISNFYILSDVTIIGEKSKTIFRQVSGNQGMFKMFDEVKASFINLTFIDGYTTPQPYSLITAYGEGVYVNVDGCEFRNNTCLNGAAIAISHGATVNVKNSKFIENRAIMMQSTAGAIYVLDGYLNVLNSEFINNTAEDGGAIWVGYSGNAKIVNSTFIENSAINDSGLVYTGGGAVYTRGITYIENSVFIRNYADLYGGAIFIAGGETEITKSYFENNQVGSYGANVKGSAIQSQPYSTFNFTLEYSILLTNDNYDYLVLFSNNDESEYSLNYNYWGSNTWRTMNTNVQVSDYVIIQARTGTSPVYKDDNTTIIVEFKNYDRYNDRVSDLYGFVHNYTVDISSTLNGIDANAVTISNNFAEANYYPNNTGEETVRVKDAVLNFVISESDKKDVDANITIAPGNKTTITIQVPTDLANNVSIKVKNTQYSRSAGNGTIILTIDTLPGDYNVVVSYTEDENYKGFSKTTSFNIPKYPTAMNVIVEDIVEDQSAYVDINITDGATGSLMIVLNGKYKYYAVIEDGSAFKIIYDLEIGNYTVDVIYDGDEKYAGTTASTTFKVKEREPDPEEKMDGYAYISIQTGSQTTLTVRVPSDLTNNVTITINGEDTYSRKSENGIITLTIPTETAGDYSVVVNYTGDDRYNSFESSAMFKIYDYCWFINETGYRTLREAIDAAGNGDVIMGTLDVYETNEGFSIGHREMPSEPWEVVKNITITSMDKDKPVTIKGNAKRLFYVDKDSTLTLDNLILTGVNAYPNDGAAVFMEYDAYLNIINCTFTDFTADRGGAIVLRGHALVKDSIFIDNYAQIGGAIWVLASVTNDNEIILDNLTLINNSAYSYGGGIYLTSSSSDTTVINNTRFINNVGHGKGGAVYIEYGEVLINNSIFDSNKAVAYDFAVDDDIAGGAIFVSRYADVNIFDSQFISNYAQEYGGAIGCDNTKSGIQDVTTGQIILFNYYTNIDGCTFVNNTAKLSGGAISIGFIGAPVVNITDSIFDSNNAPEAAAIANDYGELVIRSSKFINNVAVNASLITSSGVYTEEEFDAITTIIESEFSDNDVKYDINQLNSYSFLTVENSTFNDDSVILISYGEASLIGVKQTKDNNGYSIVNNYILSLSKNTFINPINNVRTIKSPAYVIVLDNETRSVAIGTTYTLRAILCDDNGNIIEKAGLRFLVDGSEITASYADKAFVAEYMVTEGPHVVSAVINGTVLNQLTVKTAVLTGKQSTTMSVDMEEATVGSDAIITVNVPHPATGNVSVKVGNDTYELPIKNTEAKFAIPGLAAGEYDVEITYLGDENFAPITKIEKLTVNKITDFIFNIDSENVTTDSADIKVTLPDDYEGNVTVNVDGEASTIPVIDGVAVMSLSDLSIGEHEIEVIFDGNDIYNKSSAKYTLKLSKLESFVQVEANDVIVGSDVIVKLTLPGDASGDIIVTVDGRQHLTVANEGRAVVLISDLNVGNYTVEVEYLGNAKYLDSSNTTSFEVKNIVTIKDTVIELTVDGVKITGVLKDIDGNAVSKAFVSYTVGSKTGNVTTSSKGEFTIQGAAGQKVTVKFNGNDEFGPSIAVVTLKESKVTPKPKPAKKKVATKITAKNKKFKVKKKVKKYTITLKANKKAVKKVKVTLKVKGKTYKAKTNKKGKATFKIKNLKKKGKFTAKIRFAGNKSYKAATKKVKITVKK